MYFGCSQLVLDLYMWMFKALKPVTTTQRSSLIIVLWVGGCLGGHIGLFAKSGLLRTLLHGIKGTREGILARQLWFQGNFPFSHTSLHLSGSSGVTQGSLGLCWQGKNNITIHFPFSCSLSPQGAVGLSRHMWHHSRQFSFENPTDFC